MSSRYLRIHPKRYRPLELGRIDVFFYHQPIGRRRDGRILTVLQAHVELAYTFEVPRLSAEALGWMASANILYSGIAMGRALVELRARIESEAETEDTQPLPALPMAGGMQ